MKKYWGRQTGFALIMVIWVLVVMTSLATGFSLAIRYDTRLARDEVQTLEDTAILDGAFNYTLAALAWQNPTNAWRVDGVTHQIPWPEGAGITTRIRSEAGRIDLNLAPKALLAGLFHQLGTEKPVDALVDAIIDWRDPDDLTQPQGAEKSAYLAAGYRYGPANRPFQSVRELEWVMGFDRTLVERAAPHLTVRSRRALIDPLSADPITLASIPGITIQDAQAFVEERDKSQRPRKLPHHLLDQGKRFLGRDSFPRAIHIEIRLPRSDSDILVGEYVAELKSDRLYHMVSRDIRRIHSSDQP